MRRSKTRLQTRSVAAVILLCASFLSAYLLSSMANRTEFLWSARTSLVPGSEISTKDLVAKRAAFPDGSAAYISARSDLSHFFVLRSISAGELLPVNAVSADAKILMSSVPISVHDSDLPLDLQAGEQVNLYHVGDAHLSKEIGPPNLVLSHAFIQGIDKKSQNLGGDLTLTVSVNARSIMPVLDATATGRIVVVRVNG